MLAASKTGSNVPPDYLQATPVRILSAVAANRLRKSSTAGRTQHYPANPPQQQTAGQKPRRLPRALSAQQPQVTAGGKAQPTAARVTATQPGKFAVTEAQPAAAGGEQYQRMHGHSQYYRDAGDPKNNPGQENDTAQPLIGSDFG